MNASQYEKTIEWNNDVLTEIARGAPLVETLTMIAKGIEGRHSDMVLGFFSLAKDHQHLHLVAGPSLAPSYRSLVEDIAAEYLFKPNGIAVDALVDPVDASGFSSSFCDKAIEYGLYPHSAFPITVSSKKSMGLIVMYGRRRDSTTLDDQTSIRDTMSLIVIAMERNREKNSAMQLEQALHDTYSRMTLAIEGSGTGIWDRNIVTGEIHYSIGWKRLFGYNESQVSSRINDSYTRVHPDDLAFVQAAIQSHFDGKTDSYVVEHRIRCGDGSYKWASSRGKVSSRDEHGNPLRMIGTTTDVTAMHEMSDKVKQSVELITRLTNEIPGLVFQYRMMPDGRAQYSYVSEGIEEIYELTPQQAGENSALISERIHPEDLSKYLAAMEASAADLSPFHLEYRVVLPRQGVRWRQANARPHRMPDGGTEWHGFISDVTDRKQTEIELQEFAMIDFLTQLPNRRHFAARMQKEWARVLRSPGTQSAVLMCDLDHFKVVNDTYGHATGDVVLQHFATILRDALRKNDTVGRVGGEEFAVILSGAGLAEASIFAKRVQQRIADLPTIAGPQTIVVTVSIGIAVMKATDKNAEDALSRSDSALYRAKQLGRNRYEIDD